MNNPTPEVPFPYLATGIVLVAVVFGCVVSFGDWRWVVLFFLSPLLLLGIFFVIVGWRRHRREHRGD